MGDDPLDTPLPCDVRLPGVVFGKGVKLRALVNAAARWKERADRTFPPTERCPRCNAGVGLLGSCADPACPCPLFLAPPRAEECDG
jgi:hypothetical protein